MNKTIKYGRAVFLGRPNTGKSSLINAIMQQKVSITSPLPQTTRKITRVVFQNEKGIIMISDTPGIIGKVDDMMGKKVNTEAPKESTLADVAIMVVDMSRPKNDEENRMLGIVRKLNCKKVLVYNKLDKAVGPKDHLADYEYMEDEFDKSIKTSALKEINIKGLVNLIFELLPEKDESKARAETDSVHKKGKPVIGMEGTEFVAEIIREKTYLFLRDEIPYTINVEVNDIKDKGNIIVIKAKIITTADRYKKIIVGSQGQKIKEIGYNSRKELELMSGKKVFLELTVETNPHWMEAQTNRM